jgi:hypothetical protein
MGYSTYFQSVVGELEVLWRGEKNVEERGKLKRGRETRTTEGLFSLDPESASVVGLVTPIYPGS